MQKQKHFRPLLGVWGLLFPLVLVGVALLCLPLVEQRLKAATEEQGTCTILSQKYEDNSNTDSMDYLPVLTYEVTARDGRHYRATGYNGPFIEGVPSEDEAQSILKQFSVGSTHPCWYPRGMPTKAVLVIHVGEYVAIPWLMGVGLGLFLAGGLTWLRFRRSVFDRWFLASIVIVGCALLFLGSVWWISIY